MAPLNPIQNESKAKRVHDIIQFAKKTSESLKNRNQISATFLQELDSRISQSFPLPFANALAENASTFDSLACEVWNGATNILRDPEIHPRSDHQQSDTIHLVILLRVFAFFSIDAAYQATSKWTKDLIQRIRCLKIGLKACRFCLEQANLELAFKVLERCSEHVSECEKDSPLVRIAHSDEGSEQWATMRKLRADFYLLRLMHAWKSGRLDLADHFFDKVPLSQLSDSASLSEKAADLFYEVGKSQVKQKARELAIIWLQRALNVLDQCDPELLSQNSPELRLAITSSLVESLLRSDDHDSFCHAQGLIEQLRITHGFANRMAVQLMQLNVLLAQHTTQAETLTESMSQVVRSAVLTDRTFKTIMQAIDRVRGVSVHAACLALGDLITARLLDNLPEGEEGESAVRVYVEKACVTYILFVTAETGAAQSPGFDELRAVFDSIFQQSDRPFSANATHAAQTLMWKATGAADPIVAENWCDLLRHPLFNSAGHTNKARIGRKAMILAMARNDLNAAREAFFQMPNTTQNEGITRYIAFKVALRSNDYDFANECMQEIVKHSNSDQTYLYACVLEAQQSDLRSIAVSALQVILDKQPPGIHLPTLLRCTARLFIAEIDVGGPTTDEVMEEVVRIFENAAGNMHAFRKGTDEQWRAEVQWWSKNSYNLSVQRCGDVHPEYLIRLLGVCIRFIDAHPDDADGMHQDGLKNRKALCHFLSASALIVLGRSTEEGSEYSLQSYLQARQEISAFRSVQRKTGNEVQASLKTKTFELLKFDLECILKLRQWDQLDEALQACLSSRDVDRWDVLADVVLIIRQQAGVTNINESSNASMHKLLDRIINDTWHKDKDVVKASRWLRLSFTMDLEDAGDDFALQLLQQAANMARKGYNKEDGMYPETELQWLSITAFNKAVDLLSSSMVDAAKAWIEGALEFARYAADNGALHANLTDRSEQAIARTAPVQM